MRGGHVGGSERRRGKGGKEGGERKESGEEVARYYEKHGYED